ncbi:MAG: hypothetical protein F6K65_31150 [Moorea sp. SIO3C2]|nr:hypothetical protein [Moorena sp. SIO3C2]
MANRLAWPMANRNGCQLDYAIAFSVTYGQSPSVAYGQSQRLSARLCDRF